MAWRGNKNNIKNKIFSVFLWFLITSSEKSFPRRASIKGKGETLSLFKELVNGREGCQWGQNNLRPKSSFITTTFIRHHLSNRSGVVIDCWICIGPEFLCKIKISSSWRWLIKKIYNRMLVEVNGYWADNEYSLKHMLLHWWWWTMNNLTDWHFRRGAVKKDTLCKRRISRAIFFQTWSSTVLHQ